MYRPIVLITVLYTNISINLTYSIQNGCHLRLIKLLVATVFTITCKIIYMFMHLTLTVAYLYMDYIYACDFIHIYEICVSRGGKPSDKMYQSPA